MYTLINEIFTYHHCTPVCYMMSHTCLNFVIYTSILISLVRSDAFLNCSKQRLQRGHPSARQTLRSQGGCRHRTAATCYHVIATAKISLDQHTCAYLYMGYTQLLNVHSCRHIWKIQHGEAVLIQQRWPSQSRERLWYPMNKAKGRPLDKILKRAAQHVWRRPTQITRY